MKDIYKIAIVIAIIVIIGTLGMMAYSNELDKLSQSISGNWIAHSDFLEKNNYTYFQLFITPKTEGVYHGYVLVDSNGVLLCDSPITITLKPHQKMNFDLYGTIKFENHSDCDIQLPECAQIVWSITGEDLTITDEDDNIVFNGYKDIISTIISKKEWDDFQFLEKYE